MYLGALCSDTVFTYLTARFAAVSKRNVPTIRTRAKTRVPGTFLLHWYRYVLLCFYYIASGTYCGGSEFKYPGTVAKSECSILLEICPTPNPTLNLPDSVDKCKTDIKTHLLMQPCFLNFLICRFELFCRTVVTRDSNQSSSPLKYISVLRELTNNLPSMKTHRSKLDMCDANVQKHQFSNFPAY